MRGGGERGGAAASVHVAWCGGVRRAPSLPGAREARPARRYELQAGGRARAAVVTRPPLPPPPSRTLPSPPSPLTLLPTHSHGHLPSPSPLAAPTVRLAPRTSRLPRRTLRPVCPPHFCATLAASPCARYIDMAYLAVVAAANFSFPYILLPTALNPMQLMIPPNGAPPPSNAHVPSKQCHCPRRPQL